MYISFSLSKINKLGSSPNMNAQYSIRADVSFIVLDSLDVIDVFLFELVSSADVFVLSLLLLEHPNKKMLTISMIGKKLFKLITPYIELEYFLNSTDNNF